MKHASPTIAPRRRTPKPKRSQDHTGFPPQDQPADADRQRDKLLADELAKEAGDTIAARHRNGSTAIANEADGVPEDEDMLDYMVLREADDH